MSGGSPEITLPSCLAKALQFSKQITLNNENLYEEFISYAVKSASACKSSEMNIQATFKMSGSMYGADEGFNDNLLYVYNFYAKIMADFHAIEKPITNDLTMNFVKFEIFCRDFDIVPRLLSIDEIKCLWKNMAQNWQFKNERPFVTIVLDEFKELLVRMALMSYHKPGLKKLIFIVDGFMPKNSQIVNYFLTYLHMHDVSYIRHHIRTVGRKSQGIFNNPHKGESISRTKDEIIRDKELKRFAQVQKARSKLAPHITKKFDIFGQRIKERALPSDVHEKIQKSPPKTRFRAAPKLPEIKDSRLPEYLLTEVLKMDGRGGSVASSGDDEGSLLGISRGLKDDESQFQESVSAVSSSLSIFQDNSFETLLQCIEEDYKPSLKILLKRFCYIPPKVISSEEERTGGPFLDLGLLFAGATVSVHLYLQNVSQTTVHLDVKLRGFQTDSDVTLECVKRPVAAGLCRKVKLSFSVPPGRRAELGFVDVICKPEFAGRSNNFGMTTVVSCPVFFRVDPTLIEDDGPRCTAKTLPTYAKRFLGKTVTIDKSLEQDIRLLQTF